MKVVFHPVAAHKAVELLGDLGRGVLLTLQTQSNRKKKQQRTWLVMFTIKRLEREISKTLHDFTFFSCYPGRKMSISLRTTTS